MLFLSNELNFPSEGGGAGGIRPSDLILGAYALLTSGFSWRQTEMMWKITQRRYVSIKKVGGVK